MVSGLRAAFFVSFLVFGILSRMAFEGLSNMWQKWQKSRLGGHLGGQVRGSEQRSAAYKSLGGGKYPFCYFF